VTFYLFIYFFLGPT